MTLVLTLVLGRGVEQLGLWRKARATLAVESNFKFVSFRYASPKDQTQQLDLATSGFSCWQMAPSFFDIFLVLFFHSAGIKARCNYTRKKDIKNLCV